MVIWFLGKSGSGKTYLGHKLYLHLKETNINTVFLDGDVLRATISNDLGHSLKDRFISEQRRSQLSKILADQGINVIVSGISNEPQIRKWNRININNYLEIYLRTENQTLYDRDSKGIYKKFKEGKLNNVVGEDIHFNIPLDPWMSINNDSNEDSTNIISTIISKLNEEKLII